MGLAEAELRDFEDVLRAGMRSSLWVSLGLSEPVPRAELWRWVLTRRQRETITGERIVLRMPPLMPGDATGIPSVSARRSNLIEPNGEFDTIPAVCPVGGRWWVSTFAGVYLTDDLTAWPPFQRWSESEQARVQELSRVALGANYVSMATGCTPEDATLFLLCDEPMGMPQFRASFYSDHAGVYIYAPDRMVTADELGAWYAVERQKAGFGKRARRPSRHTAELIAFVESRRPRKGRHPNNLPWGRVWDEWQAAPGQRHPYADQKSMRTAYDRAVGRRERTGPERG